MIILEKIMVLFHQELTMINILSLSSNSLLLIASLYKAVTTMQ